ncbi:MAG: DUF6156 family protein [Methylotenera sp.]|jgi:hypothetical protein
MCEELQGKCRYFVTYSGVKLPLKLSQPLGEDALSNRNTFFRAYFDDQERMTGVQKIVYGEVELEHRYAYYDNSTLKQAVVIDAEGEATMLYFDEAGQHITNK